jgi:hypothetical protein
MPHRTPGLTARERLVARGWHYVVFGILSLVGYGAVVVVLGEFPELLLLGILVASFLKDVFDEYRLWQGRVPLGYAGIEHSPSNAVLIAFLLLDVIEPTGTVLGVSVESVALWLAAIDLVFDLSQDARA